MVVFKFLVIFRGMVLKLFSSFNPCLLLREEINSFFNAQIYGALSENIVQNHLNMALLNVF